MKKMSILLVVLLLLVFSAALLGQQKGYDLYQKALTKEKADGDLEGAIQLFREIIKEYSQDQSLAANALLHMGLCYEKLGKTEAIQAYEQIVEKYAGQKEQVATAQARLAELKQEMDDELKRIVLDDSEWQKPAYTQLLAFYCDGRMAAGAHFKGRMKAWNIVLRDLDTNETRFLTHYSGGDADSLCFAHHPVFSPSGKEIAYYCSGKGKSSLNALMVVTLEGQSRVLISDTSAFFVPQDWMPDGSAVLTLKVRENESNQLGFVPREGGVFTALASLKGKKSAHAMLQTFENHSVSPDGKYILFTDNEKNEKHDIYIMESSGGEPRPLVNHPAPERSVRWSRDGKYIVFCSPRHAESWALWGMAVHEGEPAGEPFLIREGMAQAFPANWTDAGLFSWEMASLSDVYTIDIDPATGKPLSEAKQLDFLPTGGNDIPSWSKDGKSLAFRTSDAYINISLVIRTDSDTRQYPMKENFFWTDGFFRWTPDGNKITYISLDKEKPFLFSLDPASGTWERTPIAIESWNTTWPMFDWTAGGKTLLLARSGPVEQGAGIVELDPVTGSEKLIYRPKDGVEKVKFFAMKCSPDYKRLAYTLNRKLMVFNLETGESQEMASGVWCPNWSKNGEMLICLGPSKSKDGHNHWLSVIPTNGGEMSTYNISENLPQGCKIRSFDWTPDGKKLAFHINKSSHEVVLYQNLIPEDQ